MERIYGMTPEKRNVSNVRVGDTILCSDGAWRTVCQNNIITHGVMGTRIHGERGEVTVLRPETRWLPNAM